MPPCRACGGKELLLVLSLGTVPLANALLSSPDSAPSELYYPLDLVFCPLCSLVQITETVPPEILFREYAYFSSFSETMIRHAQALAGRVIGERGLGANSIVVEIASNDGYLLQFYKGAMIPVLGIEPAVNIARVAEQERGIPTLTEFFGVGLARQLREQGKRADVIHAHNVMAHVADLNGFVEGLRLLLKDDGIAIVEVPYVRDMIEGCEFDTIYHEHLCYFSLTALDKLFFDHGLVIRDLERVAIHGGSLRVFVGLTAAANENQGSPTVQKMREEELAVGITRVEYYTDFGARVESLKHTLRATLGDLKHQGLRVAAYGAAAKGSTLLNYCGIGHETLEFVADRSTYKQGRYMAGLKLPIVAPAMLVERMPDYTLLLTWNFAEEILRQQAEYRERGGKFIVPIPQVTIV